MAGYRNATRSSFNGSLDPVDDYPANAQTAVQFAHKLPDRNTEEALAKHNAHRVTDGFEHYLQCKLEEDKLVEAGELKEEDRTYPIHQGCFAATYFVEATEEEVRHSPSRSISVSSKSDSFQALCSPCS